MAGRDSLRQAEAELDVISSNLERLATSVASEPGRLDELRGRAQQQRDAVLTAQRALNQNLRQWLLDDLVVRRDRLNQYHSRARLALAQIYDKRGNKN